MHREKVRSVWEEEEGKGKIRKGWGKGTEGALKGRLRKG
jgi:hypothetical protein